MILVTEEFHAVYSPIDRCWKVDLKEIIFTVHYIVIEGSDVNLIQNFQELHGTKVEFDWIRDCLIIKKWKTFKKKTIWKDLYDPDMPKGLAKTVTVK